MPDFRHKCLPSCYISCRAMRESLAFEYISMSQFENLSCCFGEEHGLERLCAVVVNGTGCPRLQVRRQRDEVR